MFFLEKLIDDIIRQSNAKGAGITGWYYSPNRKVVITFQRGLPRYFMTLFGAIDFLIHSYNLTSQYRYLYAINPQLRLPKAQNAVSSPSTVESSEERVIRYCDAVIFNNNTDFSSSDRTQTLQVIDKGYLGKQLTQNDFLMIKNKLHEYYNDKLLSSTNMDEKEKLRKVVRFFDKLKYRDYFDIL